MPWLWTRSVIYLTVCWRKRKSWAFCKILFYCIISSPKYKILDFLNCSISQQYALECWSTEFCKLPLEIWFLWSIEYIWVHLVFQVSIRQIYLSALSSKRLKYISQGLTIVEVTIGCLKHSEKKSFVVKSFLCWFALKIARVSPLKNLPSKNDELEAMRVGIRMPESVVRDCKVTSLFWNCISY